MKVLNSVFSLLFVLHGLSAPVPISKLKLRSLTSNDTVVHPAIFSYISVPNVLDFDMNYQMYQNEEYPVAVVQPLE